MFLALPDGFAAADNGCEKFSRIPTPSEACAMRAITARRASGRSSQESERFIKTLTKKEGVAKNY